MDNQEKIPKKNIFTVPEQYFENLTSKIQERIVEKPSFAARRFVYPAWSYAVATVVIVLVSTILLYNKPEQSSESLVAELSSKEIIDYLHESDIHALEIIEAGDFKESEILDLEKQQWNLENEIIEEELMKEDIEELI